MSGEIFGYLMERLLEAGALDVFYTPVQMKKNRPASKVSVLCKEGDEQALSEILFSETTTLGVRIARMQRIVQRRETLVVVCEYGEIRMKVSDNGAAPEYEDCARAARNRKVPLIKVFEAAIKAYNYKNG